MSLEEVKRKYRQFINQSVEHSLFDFGPLNLTHAISGGYDGVLSGKIYQIVGRESSGKTTLAVDIAAQFVHRYPDQTVLWVDFERSVDYAYFESCGFKQEHFIRLTPNYAEDGLNAVQEFIEGGVKLVVIDSVAFAVPRAHAGKSFGETMKMAATAALMTEFCKRMVPLIDNNDAAILLINQLRKNFSAMSHEEHVPFGGTAIQQATNVTVMLNVTSREEQKQYVAATVYKNKQGAPRQRVEFPIVYGKGIDHAEVILSLARNRGLIEVNGSWYKYRDVSVQGIEKAKQQLPIGDILAQLKGEEV